ncbi:23S rRNA (guanosine(2251)-2'-O)-methyltransferase RlmB [Actinoallomurus purpureus]|uniref:23S rRNA (guanosine(2251)-2'-O)-methyltransferase RlmB n=1 Tax=Actinoallomurus purpureus TaxID=478114 RepID=UPI002093D37F|nr:23S rRNA (guanosine(2251)-2'-O)-methyltransferase RlmB [Actinoallomurus purpureus]MCO6010862.1 23S rRNA (guanosine(2251)-2'-O)-methyltransferase RlmB [Actinoallomurus purpureus]
MSKRRKKGPSRTLKAEDRHWYGNRQTARAEKSATRTGTATAGSRRASSSSSPADRPARRPAPEGPELVTGRNPVVEALRAGIPASALYVMTGASDDRVRESIKLATDAGVPLLEAGRAELDRMTDQAVHQGIVLQVPEYRYAHPDDLLLHGTPQLIVALDGVTDPRNVGAIVRSAAAFGAHGVLLPERRAAGVTAGAWKTSAGTLASVPVARATNLVRALKAYQSAGLFVAGLDARGAVGVGSLEAASGPLVLVIGSEGKGLSRLVAETCDLLVNIPMGPKAESLNAGVAAGIALYEISRRRS